MKSKMADFESAAGNLRNSRHQVRSLDLENKSLHSQLELAKEELEKLNCRMADTKRLIEDSENLASQKMALETQLKLTSKELQEERQAVQNAQKESQEVGACLSSNVVQCSIGKNSVLG
jgi:seryl-tRNA synthetase